MKKVILHFWDFNPIDFLRRNLLQNMRQRIKLELKAENLELRMRSFFEPEFGSDFENI